MNIRAAQPTDIEALLPLFEQWGHPQTRDQLAALLTLWSATPSAEILLADERGEMAGMAAVSASPRFASPGYNATLAGRAVAEHHRRRGVANRLLDAAEATARSWGCARVELTSSRSRREAHEFYRARGYEETSQQQARYVRPLSDGSRGGI